MYKRIFCFVLAVLMMCGAVAFSVSAYEPSLESLFKEPFIDYLEQNGASVDEEFIYINYIGSAGKCSVYRAYYGGADDIEPSQIIGDYKFTYGALVGDEETNPTGLFAWDQFGFGILPLKEAYEKGYADLDALYESAPYNCGIYPLTENEKEILIEEKCKAEFMEEFGIASEDEEEVYVYFAAEFKNYTIFRATAGDSPALETYQYIDGYWFWAGAILGDEQTNPTGLYTLDNYGNVESLKETAIKGYVDMDDVFLVLSEKCEIYMRGDIDEDKKLTVKDATFIQKYLAKVSEAVESVRSHYLGVKVMDTDLSGGSALFGYEPSVNVKDVTYIQKEVAKIISDNDCQVFSYDNIVIYFFEEGVKEYTLDDFPEYEFESLERWDSQYAGLTVLTLYLKNPGKANVIDAMNSLKYREGVEFDVVSVNHIEYPAEDDA